MSSTHSRFHPGRISEVTRKIAAGALQQLSKIPAPVAPEVGVDPKSGRLLLEKAAKLYPAMHEVGFGLVQLSSDDESLPAIWKKEVVEDPKTGAKVEWLVAYTTDDDDIMREVSSSLKVAEAPPAGGGGGEKSKSQVPIAPGVLNKNLNLDQSGQGGTAKVTVEFNDLAKGQEFFDKVEENAGGAAGGGKEAAPAPEAAPEKEEEAPTAAPKEEEKGAAAGGPPVPTPAGAGAPPPAPLASTIRNMTFYGQQMVTVKAEKFANYPTKYFYVNELGERVDLKHEPKLGTKIQRPDQPQTQIRIAKIESISMPSDDDEIIKALAVDVSDQVPPMSWQNKESQNEEGEAGKGGPLPPNPALQPGQSPTADTTQPTPLYDSNQQTGMKPHYNLTVNPEDNSVTVKMDKPDALQAIDQAVQGPQPPLAGAPPAQQQQQPGAGAGPGAPMAGQPKDNFNQVENPTTF